MTTAGLAATVLIPIASAVLGLYVDNFGPYNQIYGQVGAIIVLMLWLYSTGLMVLIGAEMNAVLARMAEKRKDTRSSGRKLRPTRRTLDVEYLFVRHQHLEGVLKDKGTERRTTYENRRRQR